MQNPKAAEFAAYFDRIRERTMRVVACVPPDRVNWTYKEGKFTFGDVMRHLAAIERWMFTENAQGKPSIYPGHGPELAERYDEIVGYMHRMHEQSMAILRELTDEQFDSKCVTPGGAELRVGKWLRSMVEHEVHHRGQLYLYLGLLDIPAPPIFGLTEEEVRRRSAPREGQ